MIDADVLQGVRRERAVACYEVASQDLTVKTDPYNETPIKTENLGTRFEL
jgi:hypothetical protein